MAASFFYKRVKTITKKLKNAGKPPQADRPQASQTPAAEQHIDSETTADTAKCEPNKKLFFAAGRLYHGPCELMAEQTADRQVYRDIYGRTVLCNQERFPCFDSYDYLYESRYYYRFVIKAKSLFTVIEMQDDSDTVSIYERLDERSASWYSRISPVDLIKLDVKQNTQ